LETKKEFRGQNSRTCVRVVGGVTVEQEADRDRLLTRQGCNPLG